MSRHAIDRALDMNIDGAEIREAYERPDHIYWSAPYGAWNYQRGRICLCLKETPDGLLVTTVLWSTAEAWAADAVVAPLGGGRELRGAAKVIAARTMRRPDGDR